MKLPIDSKYVLYFLSFFWGVTLVEYGSMLGWPFILLPVVYAALEWLSKRHLKRGH